MGDRAGVCARVSGRVSVWKVHQMRGNKSAPVAVCSSCELEHFLQLEQSGGHVLRGFTKVLKFGAATVGFTNLSRNKVQLNQWVRRSAPVLQLLSINRQLLT